MLKKGNYKNNIYKAIQFTRVLYTESAEVSGEKCSAYSKSPYPYHYAWNGVMCAS